jgi:hypothetical protein
MNKDTSLRAMVEELNQGKACLISNIFIPIGNLYFGFKGSWMNFNLSENTFDQLIEACGNENNFNIETREAASAGIGVVTRIYRVKQNSSLTEV